MRSIDNPKRWPVAGSAGMFDRDDVPDSELVSAGLEFCELVASRTPLGGAHAKFVFDPDWADGTGIEARLRLEREGKAQNCLTSEDAQERLAALGEKRSPLARAVGDVWSMLWT